MSRQDAFGNPEWESFGALGLELMNILPPARYAINASPYGLVIYDRDYYGKPTPWEQLIWQSNQPLPADWTGFLSACFQPATRCSDSNSATSWRSRKRSLRELIYRRVEAEGSIETRLYALRPECSYDGANQEAEATTPDI